MRNSFYLYYCQYKIKKLIEQEKFFKALILLKKSNIDIDKYFDVGFKAAANGKQNIIMFLIENNINQKFIKKFIYASANTKQLKLTQHLINLYPSLLTILLNSNNIDVRTLAQNKYDEEKKKNEYDFLNCVRLNCIKYEDFEKLKKYIKNGVDIDCFNGEALFVASRQKNYAVINLLIEKNCDIRSSYHSSNDMKIYIENRKKWHDELSILHNKLSHELKNKNDNFKKSITKI